MPPKRAKRRTKASKSTKTHHHAPPIAPVTSLRIDIPMRSSSPLTHSSVSLEPIAVLNAGSISSFTESGGIPKLRSALDVSDTSLASPIAGSSVSMSSDVSSPPPLRPVSPSPAMRSSMDACPTEAAQVFSPRSEGSPRSEEAIMANVGVHTGMRLDNLRTIRFLGQGSFGVVELVEEMHNPANNNVTRQIALKTIRVPRASEQVRQRIALELRALDQSSCPYIVGFYDAFYTEGCVSIALEYMDQGTLADVLMVANRMTAPCVPEMVISGILWQICNALHYLHKTLHLVHRDIKPSNVLLNQQGWAKIADFGVSGQLDSTLQGCDSWVGTDAYMSPERIAGKTYTYDADVWSVGLIAVECVRGVFPYAPDSERYSESGTNSKSSQDSKLTGSSNSVPTMGFWQLMELVVNGPTPTLKENEGSAECRAFIAHSLCKDPADRYSAHDLLQLPFCNNWSDDNLPMPIIGRWVHSIEKS